MQEKENVLKILEETKKSLEKEDIVRLKELSNQTIHTASITQDPDNLAIAIIIYSLSKIIERKYHKHPKWDKNIITAISNSERALRKNDDDGLKKNLELIRKLINKLPVDLKRYIQDVFRKASINKASKLYEHGISMGKTAELLGITMYELASYVGQTPISNAPLGVTSDAKERIKLAMEMFS